MNKWQVFDGRLSWAYTVVLMQGQLQVVGGSTKSFRLGEGYQTSPSEITTLGSHPATKILPKAKVEENLPEQIGKVEETSTSPCLP